MMTDDTTIRTQQSNDDEGDNERPHLPVRLPAVFCHLL